MHLAQFIRAPDRPHRLSKQENALLAVTGRRGVLLNDGSGDVGHVEAIV
jgi:hypothetical protein